jgi:indole-3-glycerol phosphate synthase
LRGNILTILDEILAVKKEEVSGLHSDFSLTRFKDSEFFDKARLSLFDALYEGNDISIIAEIKKASPSKGVILENFDHKKIADIYIHAEVGSISILTDKNFFQGNIEYLRDIAAIKTCPLLRKDFIIDEYQVYEAKSNGADVILLIAEALSKSQISELTHAAEETDLEVLLELHSESQLNKIDFELNRIIGINNRNLENFNVDLDTTSTLCDRLPEELVIVSESGIKSEADLKILKDLPVNAVLVGEHLISSDNIDYSLKQLKEWCIREG